MYNTLLVEVGDGAADNVDQMTRIAFIVSYVDDPFLARLAYTLRLSYEKLTSFSTYPVKELSARAKISNEV